MPLMLALDVKDFMVQLKDGAINNIGGPTKSATAKLFGIESSHARAFGDNRVKIICQDDTGNEIQLALFPEHVHRLEADITDIRESGDVQGL